MKKNKPTTRFWTVLVTINMVAIFYPISLLLRADGSDSYVIATVVLVAVGFLLAITDTISILLAYSL